jgi:hypothetical protein
MDTRLLLGSGFERRVLLDGVVIYLEGASDGGLVHPCLCQVVSRLEEVSHLSSGTLAGGLTVQPQAGELLVVRTGSGYRLKSLRTSLEHAQHHVPEILQEVETIRYLDGTRRRPTDGVGILAAAIAAAHFDAGVLRDPRDERTGVPVRQHVHQPVVLQVHKMVPQLCPRLKEKSSTLKILGVAATSKV